MRWLEVMSQPLILINPWIHDFAAYDLWAKPLGLLSLAARLRRIGYEVSFVDCLAPIQGPTNGQDLKSPKRGAYGTGKFPRTEIQKPAVLAHINRPYSRYGILPRQLEQSLKMIESPAAILVTSLMTYWYPGVLETIRVARLTHPHVPIILGGIYARLCTQHAISASGADHVISLYSFSALLELLKKLGITPTGRHSNKSYHPYPAFDLVQPLRYVCLLTSTGCPYRCHYCASSFLFPRFEQKDPEKVFREIAYWSHEWGVKDIAFYDDALLVNARAHFIPLMERVIGAGLRVRFHTPNGIHIREVNRDVAQAMREGGFVTVRIGLETADFDGRSALDNKLTQGEFERGVRHLIDAGFSHSQIGAYILVGLPDQSVASVERSIDFVASHRVMPHLAEYSPLPHTPLWAKALKSARYDIEREPLFHNNTLLPCWDESKARRMKELKAKVKEIRANLRSWDTQSRPA